MLFAVLCLAASLIGTDVDLSGVWRVEGDGLSLLGQRTSSSVEHTLGQRTSSSVENAHLPGTLAAAHLGRRWTERDFQTTMDLPQSEALAQEWQYVGRTVWSRTVDLSEADCRAPAELFLERVMWASTAFWDDKPLGTHDSLATPHVYPLPRLTPGRHTIRLEIDNSRRYNFSRQSHAYGPNMQAVWNGVLGQIVIRRAHPLRASRVFAAFPANRTLRVEVPEDFATTPETVRIDGLEITSISTAPSSRPGFKSLVLNLKSEPRPWCNTPSPVLYELELRDIAADYVERIRFGFRSLGVKDHALTLNGRRIFTRANVENANFAKDGTPWMTRSEWAAMLRRLRDEDGIDTIRFHTWCPPAAAFAAAEELGMFLQPEAGIWTDKWMSEGDEVGNGKLVDGFVERELKAIVDAYGNSPAFLSLSIGNELGNSNFSRMGEMIARLRAYDPRALYYASSARDLSGADDFLLSHKVIGKGLAREQLLPRTDWDYETLYSAAKVPVVAHEIGQWPVYPIWDELLAPFTGTMRPWNLSRHRDTAAAKNALRFQHEYHRASARLNRLIYKEEVESFLRTPSCAGLQLLSVQDYTGQAEALVGWRDPFYGLKSGFRDLPSFSTVWGPISFLARLPKFTWQVGETFRAELEIRNLTAVTLATGTAFAWTFAGERHTVRLAAAVEPGELARVATVEIPLVDAMTAKKQTLGFGTNRWDFWVYPREGRCALPEGVVATADPAEMKRAITAGRTVLYRGPSWKSAKGQFKSVYWSARWFPVANTTAAALGTWFDVRHPALADFVTEEFTDWQWYSMAEGATVHALRGLPADYRPIALSVNDFHFSDFTATMFEVLVGEGRLFVCGYDLDADTPEARRLRASVFGYLAGKPAKGTVRQPAAWLDEEFDAAREPDLAGAVYDCRTNWVGRAFRLDIRGVPPTTGAVVIDCHQPETGLTSGRGLLDGHVFEVPFTEKQGEKSSVSIPVIREDFLDGRLELEVNLMTGSSLAIDRIRIVPK